MTKSTYRRKNFFGLRTPEGKSKCCGEVEQQSAVMVTGERVEKSHLQLQPGSREWKWKWGKANPQSPQSMTCFFQQGYTS